MYTVTLFHSVIGGAIYTATLFHSVIRRVVYTVTSFYFVVGGVVYTVNFKLGEGAYAKVYQISVDEMTLEFGLQEGKVVKVCSQCVFKLKYRYFRFRRPPS